MNNLIRSGMIVLTGIYISSCASIKNDSIAQSKTPKTAYYHDYSQFDDLAEILKMEGLEVSGYGDNVNVWVQGVSSNSLSTQPLYVLDDIPLGNSYLMAKNAINIQNIASVNVVRHPVLLSKWGVPGSTGVILINSKPQKQRLKVSK